MAAHPDLEIGGNSLEAWVLMERKMPLRTYAQRMAMQGWGGAVEIAAYAHLTERQVHVLERISCGDDYRCIAQFGCARADTTIFLQYEGRSHYNVLVPQVESTPPPATANSRREAVL